MHTIQRGLEKQRLVRENIHLRQMLSLYHLSERLSGFTVH